MNFLNNFKTSKKITLAVVFSLGAVFSANASSLGIDQNSTNSTSNIQSTISSFLVAQGNAMVVDLSTELEKSISSNIERISIDLLIDESLAWLTADEVTTDKTKVEKTVNKAKKIVKSESTQ
jgi:hypothetical protein